MKLILIYLFLICSVVGLSQNVIFIGTKSYPSTANWAFLKSGKYSGYENDARFYVCFAKDVTVGYFVFSTNTFSSEEKISGPILFYMKDGNVLTFNNCISKDYVNEESVVVYSVTPSQFISLKIVDISKIRYSIVCPYDKKGFTAENKNLISGYPLVYESHETAKEIKELLEK